VGVAVVIIVLRQVLRTIMVVVAVLVRLVPSISTYTHLHPNKEKAFN